MQIFYNFFYQKCQIVANENINPLIGEIADKHLVFWILY